jgi:predicted phage-related endonuclease
MEAKTVSPDQFETWNGALPLAYTLQCLTQQMCTGAAWGTVAVLVTNRAFDLHLYAVPRHAAAEAKIAEAVRDFWRAVDAGEQPPPVMPQDRKTLAEMFRSDTGETIDLSGNNLLPELLDERRGLKAAYKTAEERIAEIDDEVKLAMGTAAIGTLPGWRITWRSTERKEFTVPAKTVRTLRIAKNGDTNGQ